MASSAYRDARAALPRVLPVRTRRRRHLLAIAVAAVAVVGIAGDTLIGLVCWFAVAAYALGFAAALNDADQRVSVAVVTVLGVVAAVFVVALSIPLFSVWNFALAAAVIAGALVSSVASFVGFRSGSPLQVRTTTTYVRAPLPAKPRVVVAPVPVQQAPRRQDVPRRHEAPLDELPESWRSAIFAVRLKRRQLAPSRLR